MHIISLSVENFMGIKAARIPVGDGVTTIAGRNGQGKTSLLNALMWAIGGDKLAPEEPIRRGAKKAEVIVETEAWTINRVRTKGGSRLELASKDTPEGKLIPNAQALLDKAVGDLTFDPMSFLSMRPKERARIIRQTLGIEEALALLDAQEKDAEAARLLAHREKTRAAGALAATPAPLVDLKPIDVTLLQRQIAETQREEKAYDAQHAELLKTRERLEDLRREREEIEKEIGDIEAWLRTEGQRRAGEKRPDSVALTQKLADASAHNVRAANAAHGWKLARELEAADEAHSRAEAKVQRVRQERTDLIAAADIPVEGLSLEGDAVLLDGVPFEQASTARQMNAAVALGLAQGRDFPLILIRQGSLYDTESLSLLAKIAEEFRAQVMVERVTDGQRGPYITIEDGEVADQPAEAAR